MAGFSRSQRIQRREDFVLAQRRGVAARCRLALVLVHVRGDRLPARLGVVASRKVGGAVKRNRAKRLLREWFRGSSLPTGLDVVVVAYPTCVDETAERLAEELSAALERALARLPKALRPPPPEAIPCAGSSCSSSASTS